jgi:hypothetical protein
MCVWQHAANFSRANFTAPPVFAAASCLFYPAPKLPKYSMDLNIPLEEEENGHVVYDLNNGKPSFGHAVFDLNNGKPSFLPLDFPLAFGLISFPFSYYLLTHQY